MQSSPEPRSDPARASASVILVRDAPGGLEVFLLKRSGRSAVLGGTYVFPGGKLDDEDAAALAQGLLDSPAAALQEALGEPDLAPHLAAALHVAGMREAFEESGVLFARGAGAVEASRVAALVAEGLGFHQAVERLGLTFDARALTPWSRWITPSDGGVTLKRFDTRFFLARVPDGQTASHDDHEATESVWLTPRAALERYWDRAIELVPPQIMTLAHLARHATVESVLAEARTRKPPCIQPEPFMQDGMRVLCYPGDERHSVRTRALPGPTRLHYRERRFEPTAGFEGLFTDS